MSRQHVAFLRILCWTHAVWLVLDEFLDPIHSGWSLWLINDQSDQIRGFSSVSWYTKFIQYKLTSVSAALMGIIRFLLTVRTVAVAAARYIGLRNISDSQIGNLCLIWRKICLLFKNVLLFLSAFLFTMTLRQGQLRVRNLISNWSGSRKLNRDLDVPIAVWTLEREREG